GGTAEASKSYFGGPPCETIVAGDINGDCEINFEDFRIMALHWMWQDTQGMNSPRISQRGFALLSRNQKRMGKNNKESPSARLSNLFKHPPAEARKVAAIAKVCLVVNMSFSL
ncbi:MAG: hypothetical protein JXN61_01245, partial [Sedimentisphaerales bacterium]|nr:hypothetical protein [Sedimentisphaerales bacterium]